MERVTRVCMSAPLQCPAPCSKGIPSLDALYLWKWKLVSMHIYLKTFLIEIRFSKTVVRVYRKIRNIIALLDVLGFMHKETIVLVSFITKCHRNQWKPGRSSKLIVTFASFIASCALAFGQNAALQAMETDLISLLYGYIEINSGSLFLETSGIHNALGLSEARFVCKFRWPRITEAWISKFVLHINSLPWQRWQHQDCETNFSNQNFWPNWPFHLPRHPYLMLQQLMLSLFESFNASRQVSTPSQRSSIASFEYTFGTNWNPFESSQLQMGFSCAFESSAWSFLIQ